MFVKCRANARLRGAGYEKATLSKCTVAMPQKKRSDYFLVGCQPPRTLVLAFLNFLVCFMVNEILVLMPKKYYTAESPER